MFKIVNFFYIHCGTVKAGSTAMKTFLEFLALLNGFNPDGNRTQMIDDSYPEEDLVNPVTPVPALLQNAQQDERLYSSLRNPEFHPDRARFALG